MHTPSCTPLLFLTIIPTTKKQNQWKPPLNRAKIGYATERHKARKPLKSGTFRGFDHDRGFINIEYDLQVIARVYAIQSVSPFYFVRHIYANRWKY
jgi:hypothetical protein